MRNGADWLIREGRLPRPAEVLGHMCPAPRLWDLNGANHDIAVGRAQAAIERALLAAAGPIKGLRGH